MNIAALILHFYLPTAMNELRSIHIDIITRLSDEILPYMLLLYMYIIYVLCTQYAYIEVTNPIETHRKVMFCYTILLLYILNITVIKN